MDNGAVYVNDPVVDVSPNNDWSQVRVWNIPANAWGGRVYPVQGFIAPQDDSPTLLADTTGNGTAQPIRNRPEEEGTPIEDSPDEVADNADDDDSDQDAQ